MERSIDADQIVLSEADKERLENEPYANLLQIWAAFEQIRIYLQEVIERKEREAQFDEMTGRN